jgi:CheY-like chemotaxis protein
LTAYARPEERGRALAAGYQIHISKPVNSGELTSAIASLISRLCTLVNSTNKTGSL